MNCEIGSNPYYDAPTTRYIMIFASVDVQELQAVGAGNPEIATLHSLSILDHLYSHEPPLLASATRELGTVINQHQHCISVRDHQPAGYQCCHSHPFVA
jgi:hypothetical protein